MEPIGYLTAPVRRWPVIIPFILIGFIIAILVPANSGSAYPVPSWEATAVVGLTPQSSTNGLGSDVTPGQVTSYAATPAVIDAAAAAEGIPVTPQLRNDILVTRLSTASGSSGSTGGKRANQIDIAVLRSTPAQAASLTNKFVRALGNYTQAEVTTKYNAKLTAQQRTVAGLEQAINAIHVTPSTATSTATTLPPTRSLTTTTTTLPKAKKTVSVRGKTTSGSKNITIGTTLPTGVAVGDAFTDRYNAFSGYATITKITKPVAPAVDYVLKASKAANGAFTGDTLTIVTTTSNATAQAAEVSHLKMQLASDSSPSARSSRVLLAAGAPNDATSTTSTTSSSSGSTTATTSGSSIIAPTVTSPTVGGTTLNTTPVTIPNRPAKVEQNALAEQLGLEVTALTRMEAHGVPNSGYKVVTAASPSSAVRVSMSGGLFSTVWVRALLGLILGALVGVATTWLLDGIDRTIRTTKRAEDVFAFPVIAEIPAPATPSLSVIPVIDVVVDPYSPIAEAYRKLHVAILTAPPVTWVRRASLDEELLELIPAAVVVPSPADVSSREQEDDGLAPAVDNDPDSDATGAAAPAGPDEPTGKLLPVAIAKTNGRSRFSILMTSPDDEPTRSLSVVNLAAVFAEAGDRVLVATTGGMRTEFEGGANRRLLGGAEPEPDVARLVANARPSQIPGVTSIALGQLLSNPSRLASNARALINAAHEVVDVLLLEAPLLTTQDGAALLPEVDLVLIVCEAWRTTISDAVRSQRLLAQRRPPVLGVVMTNMPPEPHRATNWSLADEKSR